jgi:hypothetical protein
VDPRRDKYWLLAALLFGVLVLPLLVFVTGAQLLGPYAGGGAGAFLADHLRGLGGLRWHAWTLVLGPVVVVAAWRGLGRLGA